jgi:hydroxyacylglutathione hydrolase
MSLYVRQLQLGPMQNFVYLLGAAGARETAVIDPAWDVPAILAAAQADGRELTHALLTHHHGDHVNGVESLREAVPALDVVAQRAELPRLPFEARGVDPGDEVRVGALPVTCVHTPGHTPGSQCFHAAGSLVSGDTLFIGGCGRCDFEGGDPHAMFHSLHHVLGGLPDGTVLLPGHDYADRPTSTLARERAENPYLTRRDEDAFVTFRMRPRT